MKDKIEKRIKTHIDSILRKKTLDSADYQMLVDELARIRTTEQAEKWEADAEERNKKMAELMAMTFTK